MGFEENLFKKEFIEKNGITAGLPLFDSAPAVYLPDWLWNGKEIKGEIYTRMALKFAADVKEYLRGILLLGGQATDHEVKNLLGWDLHIVSARRNDLKKLGIICSYPGRSKMGPYGQPNTIWNVNLNQLYKKIYGE